MAAAGEYFHTELTFKDMVEKLEDMAKPICNDELQNNICQYINIYLSHFGKEKVMIVGSTSEQTRLRMRQDEGDIDILVISEKSIPSHCLRYKECVPCFVNIDCSNLQDQFPSVDLIEGKHLPSLLLKECRPEAFKHILTVLQNAVRYIMYPFDQTNVSLRHKIKAGMTVQKYKCVECPESQFPQDEPRRSYDQISKNVREGLTGFTVSDFRSLRKIIDVLKDLILSTSSKTNFFRLYGPLVDAISANNTNAVQSQQIETNDSQCLSNIGETNATKASLNPNEDKRDHKSQLSLRPDKNIEPRSVNIVHSQPKVPPEVMMKYKTKSHIDLIPAFPVVGQPKGLEEWRQRERCWPRRNVVEDIYNSQIFVVAKPAILEPDEYKDFSLSYNIAEIKLAKDMCAVQKKVVLITKAFQKSILREFEENLKTFHWKNVIYWVSEKYFTSHIFYKDTEENVLLFLKRVLEHMADCLCKQEMEHYFIPSNLFASMNLERAFQILPKIVELQEDPVGSLRKFFTEQHSCEPKVEVILRECLKDVDESFLNPSAKTRQLTSLGEALLTQAKKTKCFNEAVIDVFIHALSDMKTESMRERNVHDFACQTSLDDVFNSLHSYLTNANSDKSDILREETQQCIRDFWF